MSDRGLQLSTLGELSTVIVFTTPVCAVTGCYYYDYMMTRYWYRGHVSVTRGGVRCQSWGLDLPHQRANDVTAELVSL